MDGKDGKGPAFTVVGWNLTSPICKMDDNSTDLSGCRERQVGEVMDIKC